MSDTYDNGTNIGNMTECPECRALERELREDRARIAELERERDGLAGRLKAADDVVSYLVVFGALPSDRLADLVKRRMEQRMHDKDLLCKPSVVLDALSQKAATPAQAGKREKSK